MLTLPLLSLVCFFLLSISISALPTTGSDEHQNSKRLTELAAGFYNPTDNGGSWLTLALGTYPAGLGEPINTVLSANSDYFVLTEEGFLDWMVSIDFGAECLGQHEGNAQSANLGDGKGQINQTAVLRYNYGNPSLGTCQETIYGGNHLRYWIQNGTAADSGAIFMAVSVEQDLANGHNIATPDGYDEGRNLLVGNATLGSKSPLTNRTFTATSVLTPGFLTANSSAGINHGLVIDGQVAVLTVKVASNASATAAAASTSGAGVGGGKEGRGVVVALAAVLIGMMLIA